MPCGQTLPIGFCFVSEGTELYRYETSELDDVLLYFSVGIVVGIVVGYMVFGPSCPIML